MNHGWLSVLTGESQGLERAYRRRQQESSEGQPQSNICSAAKKTEPATATEDTMVSDRLFALIALPAALAFGALGVWLWGLILRWW